MLNKVFKYLAHTSEYSTCMQTFDLHTTCLQGLPMSTKPDYIFHIILFSYFQQNLHVHVR